MRRLAKPLPHRSEPGFAFHNLQVRRRLREGHDVLQAVLAERHAVLHGAIDGLRRCRRGSVAVGSGRVVVRLAAFGQRRDGGIAIVGIVRVRVYVVDGAVGQPHLCGQTARGLEEQQRVAGLHARDRVRGAVGAQHGLVVRSSLEHQLTAILDDLEQLVVEVEQLDLVGVEVLAQDDVGLLALLEVVRLGEPSEALRGIVVHLARLRSRAACDRAEGERGSGWLESKKLADFFKNEYTAMKRYAASVRLLPIFRFFQKRINCEEATRRFSQTLTLTHIHPAGWSLGFPETSEAKSPARLLRSEVGPEGSPPRHFPEAP